MTDGELKKRIGRTCFIDEQVTIIDGNIKETTSISSIIDEAKQDFPDLLKKIEEEESQGVFGTWSGDEWSDFYDEIETWFMKWFGDST